MASGRVGIGRIVMRSRAAAGTLALAWYSSDRAVPGGSDNMPSSLADLGAATKFPWYGYAALVTKADTARPKRTT